MRLRRLGWGHLRGMQLVPGFRGICCPPGAPRIDPGPSSPWSSIREAKGLPRRAMLDLSTQERCEEARPLLSFVMKIV